MQTTEQIAEWARQWRAQHPREENGQQLFASAAATPRYKSLWVDRSGNVHGSMSAMGHDETLRRIPGFAGYNEIGRERRAKAMQLSRGRVQGDTLYAENGQLTIERGYQPIFPRFAPSLPP